MAVPPGGMVTWMPLALLTTATSAVLPSAVSVTVQTDLGGDVVVRHGRVPAGRACRDDEVW